MFKILQKHQQQMSTCWRISKKKTQEILLPVDHHLQIYQCQIIFLI